MGFIYCLAEPKGVQHDYYPSTERSACDLIQLVKALHKHRLLYRLSSLMLLIYNVYVDGTLKTIQYSLHCKRGQRLYWRSSYYQLQAQAVAAP